ncbi:cytochrome P450 [Streptomyces sp. NPDC087212]|uniref:cytochrome P450 n=1 Tax=Streptomyces sp. NPDC087212 TaxID=3365766 RepID=UPI003812E3A0
MVHLLLDRPERYALLRDEPARVPAAVEKLLRYAQAAMGAHLRVAVEDVTLSGVTIGAGDLVVALMASAHRDEDAYHRPDLLALTRTAPSHLAFAHGARPRAAGVCASYPWWSLCARRSSRSWDSR